MYKEKYKYYLIGGAIGVGLYLWANGIGFGNRTKNVVSEPVKENIG